MTHQEIATSFNSFVDFLNSNECCKCNIRPKDDVLLRRIIFSRLYYALYHKYLHHNQELALSTISGKHATIKSEIEKKLNSNWKQTYSKLYHLRIWADYCANEKDEKALNVKISQLLYAVSKLVNSSGL